MFICCNESGDIVGTDCVTGLVRYDAEGEFLEHTYYCKDSRNGFRLAMYTESLLSLPWHKQVKRVSYIFSFTVF